MSKGESQSARQVLSNAEPLSREDLADETVVHAVYEFTETTDELGSPSPAECATAIRRFDCAGNIFQYEISTALNHFGVCNVDGSQTSSAFLERLKAV
jgi:hypothetical protein